MQRKPSNPAHTTPQRTPPPQSRPFRTVQRPPVPVPHPTVPYRPVPVPRRTAASCTRTAPYRATPYLEDVSVQLGVLVADPGAHVGQVLVLGQNALALVPDLLQVLREGGDLVQLALPAVLGRQLPRRRQGRGGKVWFTEVREITR